MNNVMNNNGNIMNPNNLNGNNIGGNVNLNYSKMRNMGQVPNHHFNDQNNYPLHNYAPQNQPLHYFEVIIP